MRRPSVARGVFWWAFNGYADFVYRRYAGVDEYEPIISAQKGATEGSISGAVFSSMATLAGLPLDKAAAIGVVGGAVIGIIKAIRNERKQKRKRRARKDVE